MIRMIATAAIAGIFLAGCQSTDDRFYYTDRDCLNRQVGSRVLSTAAGVGLGLIGVPGGGIVVGLATNPRCQAYHLTPEGRAHYDAEMRREAMERRVTAERRRRGEVDVGPDGLVRPAGSSRPLDNLPGNSFTPPKQ
jgi:hypothetical protein